MLNRLPKHTASINDMLADIGRPTPKAAAKALGVSEATLRRYLKHGAPRPVLLALYWLTANGRQDLDDELHYRASFATAHVGVLQTEVRKLRATIDLLHTMGDFGSANDPGLPGQVRRAPRPLYHNDPQQPPAPSPRPRWIGGGW
ncbi:MAG: hypothetical protein WAQ08_05895 [Aquabacterium sp.]|uniref:hypothetical protein n=1 Tax=Aquabacterium sp. TaxID=1872578 RepID=UPI003BB050CB